MLLSDPMIRASRMVRLLRTFAATFAVWLVVSVLFGWQLHQLLVSRKEPHDHFELVQGMAATMLIWVLFTPPLWFLTNLLPIRRPHRVRNAVLLALVLVGVAVLRARIDVALGLTVTDFHASAASLFHRHFLLTLVVAGVATFVRLEKEEAARRRAEMQVEAEAAEAVLRQLRADLNPHFLFNTLNAVATLLHQDPKTAEEMLDKLGDLLRTSVATVHTREIRLADELEFVARYFDIQKMRFAGKLTTAIRGDGRLNDAAVPPLLLQPLVENSIIHGIGRRRDGGSVTVVVDEAKTLEGSWLRLQVVDDGPGCAPEAVLAKGRIGVANTLARLESMYGTQQSLRYVHRGGTFVAELLIPLRKWTA